MNIKKLFSLEILFTLALMVLLAGLPVAAFASEL